MSAIRSRSKSNPGELLAACATRSSFVRCLSTTPRSIVSTGTVTGAGRHCRQASQHLPESGQAEPHPTRHDGVGRSGAQKKDPGDGERCAQPLQNTPCAAAVCRKAVQQLPSQAGFVSDLRRSGRPGWGGRDRTSEWRNQNPLPYHLATPQQAINGTGRKNWLPQLPVDRSRSIGSEAAFQPPGGAKYQGRRLGACHTLL